MKTGLTKDRIYCIDHHKAAQEVHLTIAGPFSAFDMLNG